MVKMGPYFLDHSWNWSQGLEVGRVLPRKGSGGGPGGMRDRRRMSLRRMRKGMARRLVHVYQEARIERRDIAEMVW